VNEIVWEEPPSGARGRRRSDWTKVLDPLKAHPNRWAKIITGRKSSSAANHIRKSINDTRFEVIARKVDDGTYSVDARWTGTTPAKHGTVTPDGKGLFCDDCDGDPYPTVSELAKHTAIEHGRAPSTTERTPRKAP
jgi:hypothetical protein